MPKLTVLETLIVARKKIRFRKHWVQGDYARGKSGRSVEPAGQAAVCFCLAGAVLAVPYGDRGGAIERLRTRARELYRVPPERFNDTHSHKEVLGFLDTVISELKGEAA
jgi:hypothetical protein